MNMNTTALLAAPTLNATNAIREGRTRLNNQAAPQS